MIVLIFFRLNLAKTSNWRRLQIQRQRWPSDGTQDDNRTGWFRFEDRITGNGKFKKTPLLRRLPLSRRSIEMRAALPPERRRIRPLPAKHPHWREWSSQLSCLSTDASGCTIKCSGGADDRHSLRHECLKAFAFLVRPRPFIHTHFRLTLVWWMQFAGEPADRVRPHGIRCKLCTESHLGHSNRRCSKPMGPGLMRASIMRDVQCRQRSRSMGASDGPTEARICAMTLPCVGRERYRTLSQR
jgi:hypothetical protein